MAVRSGSLVRVLHCTAYTGSITIDMRIFVHHHGRARVRRALWGSGEDAGTQESLPAGIFDKLTALTYLCVQMRKHLCRFVCDFELAGACRLLSGDHH